MNAVAVISTDFHWCFCRLIRGLCLEVRCPLNPNDIGLVRVNDWGYLAHISCVPGNFATCFSAQMLSKPPVDQSRQPYVVAISPFQMLLYHVVVNSSSVSFHSLYIVNLSRDHFLNDSQSELIRVRVPKGVISCRSNEALMLYQRVVERVIQKAISLDFPFHLKRLEIPEMVV